MKRFICSVAIAIVFAVAPICQAQERPALYMVSVGISKYKDQRFEKGVAFAAKDAQDVANHFASQRGKMFSSVEVRLLNDQQATKAGVEKAIDWLQANAKPNAYTLFFFAGHGGPNALGNYECSVHDTNLLLASTRLQGSWLKDRLHKIQGKRIVVLDTCHSGGFGFKGAEFAAFAACTAKQISYEHPSIQNGFFTRCFLDGLRGGADLNRDGQVTLAEIEQYVNHKLPGMTENRQQLTHYRPSGFSADTPLSHVGSNPIVPASHSVPSAPTSNPSPQQGFKTGPRM